MVEQQSRDLFDPDYDGVINARDNCLQTPKGAVITNDGCESAETIQHEAARIIMFEFNQYTLTEHEQRRLASMVEKVKAKPELSIVLIGDTSPEGSDEYNHKLAKKRSDEITRLLISQGITESKITVQEYYQKDNMIPASLQGRQHRLVALATWSESGIEMAWHIYTSENNTASK
jgi:outer membrane protein OmpA-like peptidoglycan-associated protein